MAAPTLVDRLKTGAALISGWNIWPEPLLAEIAARSGFDCVTIDMQHGLHDPVSVMRGIGGIHLAGKPAIVRIPVGDFAMASRALDMGAEAVIAPMINTAEEARAFVAAAKYPPIGERSWGPLRAQTLYGIDPPTQLKTANAGTLAIAMVETERSIAPGGPLVEDPIRRIADKTLAAGKLVGAFAWGGARAEFFKGLGYRLIALGTDQAHLMTGIQTMLKERGAETQR